jgi:hypothetical protein
MLETNRYSLLSSDDLVEWNRYLGRLPVEQQDVYFTPEYYQLYENYGDGNAQCFVFENEGDIALYPFLKNSINEIGFDLEEQYYDIQGAYGYNGIITSSYENNFKSSFFTAFDSYIQNSNIVTEFTRFHPMISNDLFTSGMEIIEDRNTVVLDLTKDYDSVWNKCYSGINRNMIRKALKNDVSISVSSCEEDYRQFFNLYLHTMKNIGSDKYYYFSETYFQNFRSLLPENHELIIAKIGDEIVCGMILMFFGRYAHYHLSGRLKEFSNLGTNNLILSEAVKIARQKGCSLFHFGGGATNLKNDLLLKFKSNFSKDKLTFKIGKKIHNKSVYNEVARQWHKMYPEKIEKYKNFVLKYRY